MGKFSNKALFNKTTTYNREQLDYAQILAVYLEQYPKTN